MANKKGAFSNGEGQPNIWVENPDGVTRTYENGLTRHSLYDARFVSGGRGYGAFPQDDDTGMLGGGFYDEVESTGTVTDASTRDRLGKQR